MTEKEKWKYLNELKGLVKTTKLWIDEYDKTPTESINPYIGLYHEIEGIYLEAKINLSCLEDNNEVSKTNHN